MLVRSISAIQSTERSMVANRIERGQVLENINMHNEALLVYQLQLELVQDQVSAMEQEYESLKETAKSNERNQDEEEPESDVLSRCKLNLNLWRELEHKLVFFMASCHHVLKNQEQEADLYRKAADLREVMLEEFSINFFQARDIVMASFVSILGEIHELERVDLKGGLVTDILFGEVRLVSARHSI